MEVEKMSSSTRLSVLTAIGLLLGAAAAAGQGNPTGALSGHVAGQDGLALPGVLVTAASPVLQGARTATTSANGDYIIPFLPSAEYAITFEIQGFQTLNRTNLSLPTPQTQ